MVAALKLRKPNIDDVADIAMICDLYHKYKLPFENSFDNKDLIGFVDTGQLLAIDDGYGAIVGIYLVCKLRLVYPLSFIC